MVWYNFADTFITAVRNTVAAEAKNGTIKVIATDSQNDIATQANNINAVLAKKIDFICINNISPNDSASMIQKAKERKRKT